MAKQNIFLLPGTEVSPLLLSNRLHCLFDIFNFLEKAVGNPAKNGLIRACTHVTHWH